MSYRGYLYLQTLNRIVRMMNIWFLSIAGVTMTDINLDYLDEEEIMELLAMYLLMKKQRAAEKQNKRPDDNSEKFT